MGGGAGGTGTRIAIEAKNGGAFDAYVARPGRGSGPGVVVLPEIHGVNEHIRRACDELAEEGYVALAPDLFWRLERGVALGYGEVDRGKAMALLGRFDADAAIGDIAACAETLRRMPGCIGKVGTLGFCLGGNLAYLAAAQGVVDCAVAYCGVGIEQRLDLASKLRVPITFHFGAEDTHVPAAAVGAIRAALTDNPNASIFVYPGATHGFAARERPSYDAPHAAMAYSRSIAALKRSMGPHFNLEELWEYHLACEFAARDASATMRTMVAEPYVNHVPTLTGGVGHDRLKRFYKYHFVDQVPGDRKTIPISRTVGTDRIVDEKVFCFTHDIEIDWLLPGVPPTGKYVEIPLVGIVTFRGDKLANEHIYWDQASVLVQIGLLDPKGLPVAGRAQARKLLDPSRASNELMPAWQSSEGKPL